MTEIIGKTSSVESPAPHQRTVTAFLAVGKIVGACLVLLASKGGSTTTASSVTAQLGELDGSAPWNDV